MADSGRHTTRIIPQWLGASEMQHLQRCIRAYRNVTNGMICPWSARLALLDAALSLYF